MNEDTYLSVWGAGVGISLVAYGMQWASNEVCLPVAWLLVLTFVPARSIQEALANKVAPSESNGN